MVHLSINHGLAGGETAPLGIMTERHLPQALALSQALGWPYRLEDWAFALSLGEGLVVEREGRLLGTALWWTYGDAFASVGMVIVAPEARRQGLGAALMEGVLARTQGRHLVLNSTVDGFALYERLGFAAHGAVHQHQAVLPAEPAISEAALIRPLRASDLPALEALDASASGMGRQRLIRALAGQAEVLVMERDGLLEGYGCLRRWGRGIVIGPVVAGNAQDARSLIAALAAGRQGQFVRVDVTQASGLSPWLEEIGLPQVDQVVAMARGQAPQPDGHHTIYALSNQSLG